MHVDKCVAWEIVHRAAVVLVAITILIAGLHTANCTINLLNIENCTYFQTVALVLRAIHWAFLTVFPIFKQLK